MLESDCGGAETSQPMESETSIDDCFENYGAEATGVRFIAPFDSQEVKRRLDLDAGNVWEGNAPSIKGEKDDECNFLGFRVIERSNGIRDDVQKKTRGRKKKRGRARKVILPKNQVTSASLKPPKPKDKNRWIFYDSLPYKRGSNGWEECLRPRPAQVQQYQCRQKIVMMKKRKLEKQEMEIKKQKEEKVEPKDPSASRDSIDSVDKDTSLDSSKVESDQSFEAGSKTELSIGEIVWAKLGSTRWWPAMLIWGSDCGQQPAKIGQTWVFWFGDHKISEVPREKLVDFVSQYGSKYSETQGKVFKRGVVEAIKECAARAKVEISDNDFGALLNWAKDGFYAPNGGKAVYLPDSNNPIPEGVRKHLDKIKALNLSYYQGYDFQPAKVPRIESLEQEDSAIKKVLQGELGLEDVCIACDSYEVEIVAHHPLFEGGLCKQCKDDLIETMFAYGDDGTNAYCVICGNAGELLICDNVDCNRVYCTGCIEILVGMGAHKKVLATSPWHCYMCADHDPELNGLIKKKSDWQQNVMTLFQPDKHVQVPNVDDYQEKRPIRVLSLFDGIGTGKFVIDMLGIEVDAYYASEVDPDAVNVANVQNRHQIIQLGSVEDLTDAQVAKLCPIDLVIGGSPCNDLSLVNPARKGLYDPTGTGKLFFDFYRILKAVQLGNHGRHVFWLYENVASMPQEYKNTITRFLQCDPAMIDSKYFTPQNRARYFWGNIPGMHSPLQPHILNQNITLDSVLIPNCNRKATVDKIRTVTTRSNSLRQGKHSILPVSMNGESDVLWVTELELIFGFPKHYTDIGNIPLGRRQQLLGKAWSVPVIRHIFAPLRNFFKTTAISPTPTQAS